MPAHDNDVFLDNLFGEQDVLTNVDGHFTLTNWSGLADDFAEVVAAMTEALGSDGREP